MSARADEQLRETGSDEVKGRPPRAFGLRAVRKIACLLSPASWVMAWSGIIGFLFGWHVFPDWQVAVESGQVIAGLVTYPSGNAFLMYHLKLWTLASQGSALCLWIGLSEITVSMLLSGVLGMVSFQALALVVFALAEDVLLAIGCPIFVLLTRTSEFGVSYPIWLMGASHTYGILGLSFVLLVIASLGAGKLRTGGFLLGLAPAVHPSLGLWLGVILATVGIWDHRNSWALFLKTKSFVFVGACVTAASLLFQLYLGRNVPHLPAGAGAQYLSGFVRFWDGHRLPINLRVDGAYVAAMCALMSVCWLCLLPRDLPRRAHLLLRALVIGGLLGFGCAVLSWLPPDRSQRRY